MIWMTFFCSPYLSASYILGSMITFSLFITLAYVFHSICFLKVFATII